MRGEERRWEKEENADRKDQEERGDKDRSGKGSQEEETERKYTRREGRR